MLLVFKGFLSFTTNNSQFMAKLSAANQVASLNSIDKDALDIRLLVLDIDGSAIRSL